MNYEISTNPQGLMTIEAVQKVLNRSRASVYRYANTDPKGKELNLPFDAQRLNPELRQSLEEPLLFHPNEVARFAQDILGIRPVTIHVQQPPDSVTQELLRAILAELKAIREVLEARSSTHSSTNSSSL